MRYNHIKKYMIQYDRCQKVLMQRVDGFEYECMQLFVILKIIRDSIHFSKNARLPLISALYLSE